LFLTPNPILVAQTSNLAYKYEYTKITDVRFVKGALDHTEWCATDFVETQATRKKEKITTSVFVNNHFKIETWFLEDSERPSWASPIQKITLDLLGVKSYKQDSSLGIFQSFNDTYNPYSEMYDSVVAGHTIGNLPKFPQFDQADLDTLRANGYQIQWQGNGDLWIILEEIHVLKIKSSVLEVENWFWSTETGDVLSTAYYQIVAGGDTLLRKSLTIDKLELCSGACIQREKKEVYIDYTYLNTAPTPRSEKLDAKQAILQVMAFPNPFKNFINLKANTVDEETFTVQIFNLQGSVVFQQMLNGNRNELDLAYLPSGCYTLSVLSARGTTHTKIIKI
jgi:hypothetical protein